MQIRQIARNGERKGEKVLEKKGNTGARLLFYIVGLMIMTLGVAISVRSDLGVSPISSIPYTITCVAGMELGLATTVVSVLMIFLQAAILRKQFKMTALIQFPISIMFGAFMSFACGLVKYMPEPSGFAVKFIMMLVSTVVISIGVFMYVSSGYIPLPPEGTMIAIARIAKKDFGSVKRIFDIAMVVISGVTCLIVLGELGSVGIGTIIAAVLVGTEVKFLTKVFGAARDRFLGMSSDI